MPFRLHGCRLAAGRESLPPPERNAQPPRFAFLKLGLSHGSLQVTGVQISSFMRATSVPYIMIFSASV